MAHQQGMVLGGKPAALHSSQQFEMFFDGFTVVYG